MIYLIVLLILSGGISKSSSITFELKESIVLDYDWAEGVTQMAIMNGQAYLIRPLGYDIYAVDLSNKQNIRRLGGQGKGPGEFDRFIGSVYKLKDGIAVTSAFWIHFFDRTGAFQNRVFLKTTSIRSIRSFHGGQYMVGTMSGFDGENLNAISNVGIMKSRTSDIIDYEIFGNKNQIENMGLNGFVFNTDDTQVVIGQHGSNELRFYKHDGTLTRKIVLAANPSEITFRDLPQMEDYNRMAERFGTKRDMRLPSFGIVSDIALTTKLTIVKGLFDHDGSKKAFAVINTTTWDVDYVKLGAPCRIMSVENEMMYCLNAMPNQTPQIDIYRIKAN